MESKTPAKTPFLKRAAKSERERRVLLACVAHYIKSGKPVGSMTLQEEEFADLSSATIRNYFVSLEEQGFLKQQHTSGGRVPTSEAFKLFAEEEKQQIQKPKDSLFRHLEGFEGKEISRLLQEATAQLSLVTGCAACLTSPRFEQDMICALKPLLIEERRLVVVILTEFGAIKCEEISLDRAWSAEKLNALEHFFQEALLGEPFADLIQTEQDEYFKTLYQEILLRHISENTSFSQAALCRTGLSSLVAHPEFVDHTLLAHAFHLFEDEDLLRFVSQEVCREGELSFWIGDDLERLGQPAADLALISIPYTIHSQPSGALMVLAPSRIPYPELFAAMTSLSQTLSKILTDALYRYRIAYLSPEIKEAITADSREKKKKSREYYLEHNRSLTP